MLVLAIAGILQATQIHHQVNPNWYPVGQDWREFVVLGLDIQSGGAFRPVPQRYPFYAWLSVQLANFTQVPVHIGLMQVNLIAGGLLPAAVYRLGTTLTSRPIAIVGGWLALHIPTVAATLGPPTDYLFHGVIHVLALSEGIRALRSRKPSAWLGFGLCLALLMAANMKSLVFLLGAAPLVTAALIWRARESPRAAALAGLLWLAPMVTVWNIYSSTPRWTTEAYTLEYNVYRTQVVVARAHGRTAPLPTDLGWHPTDEKQRGYWGVGRSGAWSNLDKVLQFLARGPQHNLDASVRFEGAVLGLTRALHLPNAGLLLLGLLGCITPLRRRPGDTHLGPVLATGWLIGITGAQFMGLMATHFIPRYALVLLIPAPLLILSVAGLGVRRLGWFLPPAAVIVTLIASGVPGMRAIHSAPEVKEAAEKAANLPGLMLKFFPSLIETINIAAASTLLGAILAIVLSLLSTRGLAKWPRLVGLFRRLMDILRAFPEIVVALVLIFILGGGPVPAMIAIALHTGGALGKLFSEVNENASLKPVEGLQSVGATWGQRMWLGVIPQVAPNYLSYTLLRFEINIRASAILGFVGSGGIGYDLKNAFSWGQGRYDEVAAIFLLLFATIVFFDQVSSRYRNQLIGEGGA